MLRKGELYNLFYGDFLTCKGCGNIIFRAPIQPPGRVSFREISNSYFAHVKGCMSLKRIIINKRNGKAED